MRATCWAQIHTAHPGPDGTRNVVMEAPNRLFRRSVPAARCPIDWELTGFITLESVTTARWKLTGKHTIRFITLWDRIIGGELRVITRINDDPSGATVINGTLDIPSGWLVNGNTQVAMPDFDRSGAGRN